MKGARIFFVEDDEIIANVIEWRLNKLGYSVCGSAKNGVDAITLIKEKKPDLVLLDIELKGPMDGIEMGETPFVTDKNSLHLPDRPYGRQHPETCEKYRIQRICKKTFF